MIWAGTGLLSRDFLFRRHCRTPGVMGKRRPTKVLWTVQWSLDATVSSIQIWKRHGDRHHAHAPDDHRRHSPPESVLRPTEGAPQ
jgi:hypothetical protein